jgi:hypothetical protein
VYSTYLGGSSDDGASAIAVDIAGNAYVAEATESPDFPVTADASQICERGQLDLFVSKLNADGTSLLWSTYFGGAVSEWPNAITLDTSGDIYLTGYGGSILTTAGAFRTQSGGAYVTKISLATPPAGSPPFITGVVNGANLRCSFQQNSWGNHPRIRALGNYSHLD